MFDTHCHLNFKAFENKEDEIIENAKKSNINYILIPGTDYQTSVKAIEIANAFENTFAAVGIHPHHVYNVILASKARPESDSGQAGMTNLLKEIEGLLREKKVVAIGEIGIDKHVYEKTKYEDYKIDSGFVKDQITLLKTQIKLALEYNKSLIFHNREAKQEFLEVLNNCWDEKMRHRCVFHCCEPDDELLKYALAHNIYIGVDGDVTYNQQKKEFIKKVPLKSLVLETDSPYLMPEPTRSTKRFPNEPANIKIIAEFISNIKNEPIEEIDEVTTSNAKKLFNIKE